MHEVNAEPSPMPVAAEHQTHRAPSRGQQRRARAGQELREGLRLEVGLARQQLTTPEDAQQKALSRNELGHFIATLLTGGLWAPVWVYVLIRNSRRYGRTAQGRATREHGTRERARLRREQKARRRAGSWS